MNNVKFIKDRAVEYIDTVTGYNEYRDWDHRYNHRWSLYFAASEIIKDYHYSDESINLFNDGDHPYLVTYIIPPGFFPDVTTGHLFWKRTRPGFSGYNVETYKSMAEALHSIRMLDGTGKWEVINIYDPYTNESLNPADYVTLLDCDQKTAEFGSNMFGNYTHITEVLTPDWA